MKNLKNSEIIAIIGAGEMCACIIGKKKCAIVSATTADACSTECCYNRHDLYYVFFNGISHKVLIDGDCENIILSPFYNYQESIDGEKFFFS